jgi:hypothetical protein
MTILFLFQKSRPLMNVKVIMYMEAVDYRMLKLSTLLIKIRDL